MKNKLFGAIIALISIPVILAFAENGKGTESLSIGDKAPLADYKMKDVSGEMLNLENIKKENGLLVIFSCNTCPFVVGNSKMGEGWQTRYNSLKRSCDDHNVGMVLVNSNEAKRVGDKNDDSMEAMKAHAKAEGYESLYVLDKGHKLADAFGAKTTPHVFLFDKDLKLVYKGAIDDSNESADKVKNPWLMNAIKSVAAGKQVDPEETRNKGCSIKRVK